MNNPCSVCLHGPNTQQCTLLLGNALLKMLLELGERDLCSPFPSAMPTVSSDVFVGTCNFCTHFMEHLQFADSASDCFLMLLPLGSGVL